MVTRPKTSRLERSPLGAPKASRLIERPTSPDPIPRVTNDLAQQHSNPVPVSAR
jgi:hypothetical protein